MLITTFIHFSQFEFNFTVSSISSSNSLLINIVKVYFILSLEEGEDNINTTLFYHKFLCQ
jgi:hypothetical protein